MKIIIIIIMIIITIIIIRNYISTSDEKFDIAPLLRKSCNNAHVTSKY